MSSNYARSAETRGPKILPIRCIESRKHHFFEDTLPDEPLVVRGIVDHWPALKKWTPEYFKSAFADLRCPVSINLPDDGVPAEHRWEDHRAEMLLADFVDLMLKPDQRCYLHQVYATRIPGIEADYDFLDLTGSRHGESATFIWIGSGNTRSSFHFDLAANIFVQVYGRKRAYLVSPDETQYVYPYRYNIAKSRVDPERIDFNRFPNFTKATLHHAVLEPGDVLYFPRTWWHDFRSLEPSISLNHFHGQKAGWSDFARVATAGGIGHWATIANDFVWHGMLGQKFESRLFSEPPTGYFLYGLVKDSIKRRLVRNDLKR